MNDEDYYQAFPNVFRMTTDNGLLLDDTVQTAITDLCAHAQRCIQVHSGHKVEPEWKLRNEGWNRSQLWKIFAQCFAAYFDIQRNYNFKPNFSFEPPPYTPKTQLDLIDNTVDRAAYATLLQDVNNHGKYCVIEEGVVMALGTYNVCISRIRKSCTFCIVSTEPAAVYEM